jgi:hypothetical protein
LSITKASLVTLVAVVMCPATPQMQSLEPRAAAGPVTLEVKTPLVIGFFPPFTEAEKQNDDGGISEGLSHLSFALDDVAACYPSKTVLYRLEETRSITLRDEGRVRRIPISRQWERSVGIVFVAPGRAPRVVFASAGPSSLQYLGPQAAFEYFGAIGCKQE